MVIVQAGKKPEQIVHGKDFGRALSAETIDTLLPLFLAQVMMTMMMMVMMTMIRVAELGILSSGAKMAMKIFVKRVFTIFATDASFLRVIANLQI